MILSEITPRGAFKKAGGSVEAILRFLVLAALFIFPSRAQTPSVIPLSSEPHHHLVLHNQYVNVYHVEVAPQNAVLLHLHDFDAISIMLDDADVTVHASGRPDASQHLSGGQVRLQPLGYAHSTAIEGNKTYRNITVELLLPQKDESNLCAVVVAGQPLHCPATQAKQESGWVDQPQFQTDRTTVSLVLLQPHQEITLSNPAGRLLAIAVDGPSLETKAGKSDARTLNAGEFVWLDKSADKSGDKSSAGQIVQNVTDKTARIVTFDLRD
jgi:hypothetical protein